MNEIAKKASDLYKQNKKEEAVIVLTDSLKQNFKQLDLILQLSTYLSYGGELEQAEELLLRSKNIFPNESVIEYNLGNIYYNQGKYDKALAVFSNIRTNAALFMIAQCYQQLGDNNHALVYAITAAEKEHDDEAYTQLVGDILLGMGSIEQAQSFYEKSIGIKPNEKNTFNLALCLSVLDKKDAQKLFEESQKINPKYYEDNIQRLEDIQKLINGNK